MEWWDCAQVTRDHITWSRSQPVRICVTHDTVMTRQCYPHYWPFVRGNHYANVMMTTMASQITSLTVVYSTVYSDADQRKHQSSASLAFVRGIHRDRWIPRTKGQLRGKCFHLMTSSCHWTSADSPQEQSVIRNFDVSFVVNLTKQLNKQ